MTEFRYYWFAYRTTDVVARVGVMPRRPIGGQFWYVEELEDRDYTHPQSPRLGKLARNEALFRGIVRE